MPTMRPFVLGITGASGGVYAIRLLEVLIGMGHRVHLTISRSGRTLLEQELGLDIALDRFDAASLGLNVSAESLAGITYHHFADFLSPIASGSALTAGMVICPCSGGTLSAVASGSSTNLVHRAADVHLKERRRLILVTRETPLSRIHLDNMKRACEAGAVVLPASPGWYHGVSEVGQLVDFIVAQDSGPVGSRPPAIAALGECFERSGRAGGGLMERGVGWWLGARRILEMIRFSHTVFALPFALTAAVMAWTVPRLDGTSLAFRAATCWGSSCVWSVPAVRRWPSIGSRTVGGTRGIRARRDATSPPGR